MSQEDVRGRRNGLCRLLSRLTGGTDVALKLQLADRYLDPFPDDVEGSLYSIISYLEQIGQHEKIGVLDMLWRKGLLHARGTVYEQVDYGHRVLLFLIRLSGNDLQDSRVDEDCKRVLKEYCTRYSAEDRIRWEDEKTLRALHKEDELTEEGQWWRQRMVYSSGDDLSDWTLSDDSDEEGEKDGVVGLQRDTLVVDQDEDEERLESCLMEEDMVPDARTYLEQRTKPMIREDSWQLSGTEAMQMEIGRHAKVYKPTSLSVWLASKRYTAHLSDALNPRYCVTEDVFVTQMLNCIQGCANPGFVCLWEEGYVMTSGVHLENVSMDALECVAREALDIANALKRVEIHVEGLKCSIDPVVDSQSIVLSFAHALERQIQVCRDYCKEEAYGRSLLTLLSAVSTIKQPARLMESLCRWMNSGKDQALEDIKEFLDEMQVLLESLHLECSSGSTAATMYLGTEIVLSMLIPYAYAMETLMACGSMEHLPKECSGAVASYPLMIKQPMHDMVSIRTLVSRLSDMETIDTDGFNITGMVMNVFGEYLNSTDLGHISPQEAPHTKDPPAIRDSSCWWNTQWMSEIHEQDATLSEDHISSISLRQNIDQYCMPLAHSESALNAWTCVNQGLGVQVENLMVRSSQKLFQSFRLRGQGLSNYCCKTQDKKTMQYSIDTLKDCVMGKVDSIFMASDSSSPVSESQWPCPPTAQVMDTLSHIVSSHSVLLGRFVIRHGILEQLDVAKSMVLLDDFVWGRLVSGLLESCSSTSGLDSMTISNANTALSDCITENKLRRYISSVWIERCTTEDMNTSSSFASRTTSYIKLIQWHVTFRPPLDAIMDENVVEDMSNMRHLVLQVQWVWKTLSSTKKICIKLGRDIVTKQTHASLLSMLSLLREIASYIYSTFDYVFKDLAQNVRGTENIVHMKKLVCTRMAQQNALSPTQPLRDHLEIWLDACLHYGILVSRYILHSFDTPTALSPNAKSFQGGMASAEADVRRAQAALVPIFKSTLQRDSS